MGYVRFVDEGTLLKSRQDAENQATRLMKKTGEKVYKIIYLSESGNFIKKLKNEGILKRSKPFWEIIDESKLLNEIKKNDSFKIVDSFVEDQIEGFSGISDISKETERKKDIDKKEKEELIGIDRRGIQEPIDSDKYKTCLICKRIGFSLLEKEKSQHEIAEELKISQSVISDHINDHFPSNIMHGVTKDAYCKLTPELKEYFTDLKEEEEAGVITERKLRNIRYDVFTDSIFWSAIMLIEGGISVEDIRLSLNGITDEKDIKKSLVNAFRVLTVDNIIEIGSEEEDWDGGITKKWVGYTPNKIHTINEENINQINSKRIRVLDNQKLKKYHLIGILINSVRGRTNLLDYWMDDFIKIFTNKTEQLQKNVMRNVEEKLKNEEHFTDEDKRKAIVLSKVIKGELFNAGFLEQYMKPNNPEGIYFRDIGEINNFLDKVGAEFEYVASNPGEKPYLCHKIIQDGTK